MAEIILEKLPGSKHSMYETCYTTGDGELRTIYSIVGMIVQLYFVISLKTFLFASHYGVTMVLAGQSKIVIIMQTTRMTRILQEEGVDKSVAFFPSVDVVVYALSVHVADMSRKLAILLYS
uniref:Uncharacterized protein n=1 Tax=Glossina palpalis gambiensis TaxID=67801 RepID=A0A1B0BGS3_9MUSC